MPGAILYVFIYVGQCLRDFLSVSLSARECDLELTQFLNKVIQRTELNRRRLILARAHIVAKANKNYIFFEMRERGES